MSTSNCHGDVCSKGGTARATLSDGGRPDLALSGLVQALGQDMLFLVPTLVQVPYALDYYSSSATF